jgi:hypothetical protein
MKVGDLVKFKSHNYSARCWGIIVKSGNYAAKKDVKVCWNGRDIYTERSEALEVISESR